MRGFQSPRKKSQKGFGADAGFQLGACIEFRPGIQDGLGA